jgi:putative oxidoreductase
MLKRLVSTQSFQVDLGLLLLRLSTGLLMMTHGWSKLQDYDERAMDFPDPLGVGSPVSLALTIFAEFFCSILVALGFLTRAALLPLIVMSIIIVLVIHGSDPLGDKEHGLLFLFPYLMLFFAGPGKYSIDSLIKKG